MGTSGATRWPPQCLKREVSRRDNPVPPGAGRPPSSRTTRRRRRGEGGRGPFPCSSRRRGEDAGALGRRFGRAQPGAAGAGGGVAEAAAYDRLARSYMATARSRRELEARLGAFGAVPPARRSTTGRRRPCCARRRRRPRGDWRAWLFLGGRGGGARRWRGAAWLAARARACGRLALVGAPRCRTCAR